jgi:hypothetical protein
MNLFRSITARRGGLLLAGGALTLGASITTGVTTVAAASPPSVKVTTGPYHSGQLINISVGPNRFFTHYARINILECADQGGKKSNQPISESSCDGNTLQGSSILVARNGSFSVTGYEVYALPDPAIGESSDSRPICNQKHECVLYIGQNQGSFSSPKVFSAPFTVSAPKAKKKS